MSPLHLHLARRYFRTGMCRCLWWWAAQVTRAHL